MKTRLIVIDTETGGLDAQKNALLSLSALDTLDGEVFTAMIKPSPEWIVEPEAMRVNGFTLDFLEKHGRAERGVMEDFALWLGERRYALLAGCNVAFDIGFLRAAGERVGLTLPLGYRSVDLQAVAWLAWEAGGLELPMGKAGLPKLSLSVISEALGLGRTSKTHNCLEDTMLTWACLSKIGRCVEMSPRVEVEP